MHLRYWICLTFPARWLLTSFIKYKVSSQSNHTNPDTKHTLLKIKFILANLDFGSTKFSNDWSNNNLAAKWKAVSPPFDIRFGSAPWSSRSRTIWTWPWRAARWRGPTPRCGLLNKNLFFKSKKCFFIIIFQFVFLNCWSFLDRNYWNCLSNCHKCVSIPNWNSWNAKTTLRWFQL